MDILSTELPDPLRPKLVLLADYEKLDGFHEMPRGADTMLDEMKEEEASEA